MLATSGVFGEGVRNRVLAYVGSLAAVGTASVLAYYVPALHATPSEPFFAAIAIVAWMGGKGPAILATLLSIFVVDFLLVPPVFSVLSNLGDLLRFAVFVLVAFVILYFQDNYWRVAEKLRVANEHLETRVRERTTELSTANRLLHSTIKEHERTEATLQQSQIDLQQALAGAAASLKEKETLLRELHHRVKNNLQIITSILSLQRTRIHDATCQDLFKECQYRVRAIALLHQKLYGASSLANIDLANYFEQLVQELHRSYYVGSGVVTPTVDVETASLDIDRLIPCALIVNELVCNSFKYAFPGGRSGEVRVEVRRADGQVRMTVSDTGIGYAGNHQPEEGGVGLQIVDALVEQLSGEIYWSNGSGASATITFPELSHIGETSDVHSANSRG